LFLIKYCNTLDESAVIIVKGKRDIEALLAVGIQLDKRTILARKGFSTEELVDKISDVNSIILLLDFDREGKHARKLLKNSIQLRKGHGYIDPFPRQLLYKFFRAVQISEIEELK
jgi:5S rRNA maturation endonuclease (ribonuclease M5)